MNRASRGFLRALVAITFVGGLGIAVLPVPAGAVVAPLTVRLYATREGAVGGVTANGHIVVVRDHFVSLPSRLGLSAKGTGSRSVRVCSAATGRCEYAPVWDVGPWNTRDDFWNYSRQMWPSLPRGVPEAQAAYQNGFNGGRDQFGRTVTNPSGIDLADGTFWDGVGLRDNAWVTVTFLWTGTGGTTGQVTLSGGYLNVRAGPSTGWSIRGVAASYANVVIQCQVRGQWISGTVSTTNLWDRIGTGDYVSHAFVAVPAGAPRPPTC